LNYEPLATKQSIEATASEVTEPEGVVLFLYENNEEAKRQITKIVSVNENVLVAHMATNYRALAGCPLYEKALGVDIIRGIVTHCPGMGEEKIIATKIQSLIRGIQDSLGKDSPILQKLKIENSGVFDV
jgi:hypothetical protein